MSNALSTFGTHKPAMSVELSVDRVINHQQQHEVRMKRVTNVFTLGTTGDDASIALCACTLGDTIEPFQKG